MYLKLNITQANTEILKLAFSVFNLYHTSYFKQVCFLPAFKAFKRIVLKYFEEMQSWYGDTISKA